MADDALRAARKRKREALIEREVQRRLDEHYALEAQDKMQDGELIRHPQSSRLMTKLKITDHLRYADQVSGAICKTLYDKEGKRYNGEASGFTKWWSTIRQSLRTEGLGHVLDNATKLELANNRQLYTGSATSRDAYVHKDDRKITGLIVTGTLTASARERLTQLEDADDEADGVTYLAHFHERFGAAKLVTVQSAFDKLLLMMQAAQDGKTADTPPNTLFMKADQLFNSQFIGGDAL